MQLYIPRRFVHMFFRARGLFTYAYGINNAGQIVGEYGFSVDAAHGFLATPIPESAAVPDPGALLLVAGGLVALVCIRAAGRQTA